MDRLRDGVLARRSPCICMMYDDISGRLYRHTKTARQELQRLLEVMKKITLDLDGPEEVAAGRWTPPS